jgi:hypothetical protein
MVGASHAGDVSRGSYTLTENVRVRENKGLYFRPSGFASASSGLGSPPGRKLMYSEERGPRRFQVPQQHQHQHQHQQHMALIDQQGSSDSLVESAGGLLNTDAAVRLERERVERERAREQLERQRTRLEKDKALLGLSRSNITSMEEVGRPFNEARREFFAKLRDYGSVPRPATAPASKQSGVKRKTLATKGYTDANTELVRSLVQNLSTTRSIEVCMKAIQFPSEVASISLLCIPGHGTEDSTRLFAVDHERIEPGPRIIHVETPRTHYPPQPRKNPKKHTRTTRHNQPLTLEPEPKIHPKPGEAQVHDCDRGRSVEACA